MHPRRWNRGVSALLGLLFCLPAWAGQQRNQGSDWPHWLGPNYDGSSPEKGLLREWPKQGPRVLWRAKIMQGWSCPSVSGNDVVVAMTEFDKPKDKINGATAIREVIACLDAATGQERWQHSYPVKYNNNQVGWGNGGVRATPTVTDKCVYSVDPLGNIHCVDRTNGKPMWNKALAPEFFFPRDMESKGMNCSPLVHNNVLVVHNAGAKCYNFCMGLDARTGKQLWLQQDEKLREKTAPGGHGQSPVMVSFNNEPCALVSYNRYLHAFRMTDGKEVFKFDAVPEEGRNTNSAGPLVVGNRIVVLPEKAPMICVDVDRSNPALPAKMAWISPDYYGWMCYHSLIHNEGYLYGFDTSATAADTITSVGIVLVCIDLKTGKRLWKQGGFYHGYSLITAAGLLFVRSFQTLWLIEASPQGFVVKGKIEKIHPFDSRGIYAPQGVTDCVMPVLSRGKLYVRCPEELICLQVGTASRPVR